MKEEVIAPGKVPEYINRFDYNLNSPLVSEDLDNFLDFLNGRSHIQLFEKDIWKHKRSWIENLNINKEDLKGPDYFHAWMSKLKNATQN